MTGTDRALFVTHCMCHIFVSSVTLQFACQKQLVLLFMWHESGRASVLMTLGTHLTSYWDAFSLE